ncbi:MAG: BrnA antitoxin family protein, partial [Simkania sp.]|nr:BrnA antitoxin family protein [Simkania sp.]
QVTVRLDADILEWFKEQGRGYQTRMNAVLRSYVEARKDEPSVKR